MPTNTWMGLVIVGKHSKIAVQEKDITTNFERRDVVFSMLDQLIASGNLNDIAVILIEIHRFKHINDGLGYQVGDQIIRTFAERLRRIATDETILGRMGGDGFALILKSKKRINELLKQITDLSSRPFSATGNVVVIDTSMGIAFGGKDGSSAHELIRAADIALHFSETSSNKIIFFKHCMRDNAEQEHSLENDLRNTVVLNKAELLKAVSSEQFEVYYQPLICAKTRRLKGAEALLRWQHTDYGFISPEIFIPLAEEIGLIELLGSWILKKACKDMQYIRKVTGLNSLSLNVNVSPKQLANIPPFLAKVTHVLQETGFPANALTLEITENAVIYAKEYEIAKIIDLGCALALDDFGTGYSSMAVLRSLPFKVAKLDKIFVSNLFENPSSDKDLKMINAFYGMCSALSIETTIEGVETSKQADFLTQLGCDTLQGYYFSKPLPLHEFMSFIDKRETYRNEQQAI